MTAENISFFVIALMMMLAAYSVVTTTNVVRAALSLVVVLAGVAAQYILLAAEFTAVVQVMVYIGAVVVLFLFGIMLTRAKIGQESDVDNSPAARVGAAVLAAGLLVSLVLMLRSTWGRIEINVRTVPTTAQIGDAIFSQYLVPFEVVSILLLAALVGAIVLARRD